MDMKSTIPSNSSNCVETWKENQEVSSDLKDPTNTSNSIGNFNCKSDILEAVKIDPAVLEAQVTVHDNNKAKVTDTNNLGVEDKKDKVTSSPSVSGFEDMVSQQEAALLSLTPRQLELLMKYVDTLRKQRNITHKYLECAFCKNNGRPGSWYSSHALKDARGRVLCPVLRRYRCPRCGATGDRAHTIKYCPDNSFLDSLSSYSGNLY